MPLEWTTTVLGAMLCVLFGWCFSVMARNQTIWISKIGPLISVVGTVVLAGMAMCGHADVTEHVGVVPEYTIVAAPERVVTEEVPENRIRSKEMFSASLQLTHAVGDRPSTNHVVYKNTNGELSWITREDYKALLSERRKGGK